MKIAAWVRTLAVGVLAGLVAAVLMLLVMALLRAGFGISPPPESIPDRLAPTLPIDRFFRMIGEYGGYNGLKRFGVRSIIQGILGVGTLLGLIYAVVAERGRSRPSARASRFGVGRGAVLFVVGAVGVLWIASLVVLWPTLGANYRGLPIQLARVVTALGLLVAYAAYGLGLVLFYRFITDGLARRTAASATAASGMESVPAAPAIEPAPRTGAIARRALVVGGTGFALAWATRAMLDRFNRLAVYAYDGLRPSRSPLAAVTPNDQFYVVTKNVVDPRVSKGIWRLEIAGHVEDARSYDFDEITALAATTQEATLTCISNQVGDTLISNAVWKGVPMAALLDAARPKSGAVEVVLHAVDGYTDTFAIEKALEPTTLVAYEMNGEPLPDRHGYPARIIVPGLFGEKNVKWVTRIEVVDRDVKGFYEQQGWGPSFVVPTRSQFIAPDLRQPLPVNQPVTLSGLAFAGNRGVSKVEVSFDDGQVWQAAEIDYPGSILSWALWSYAWRPTRPGDYKLAVRATDAAGELQTPQGRGIVSEGATGYHRATVRVEG